MNAGTGSGANELAATILLAIVVILVAARLMARLFERFGQPPVMGELVAGILLGPTLFGALLGGLSRSLFPPHAVALLADVGDLGLVVFMFLVGLNLDLRAVTHHRRTTAAVSLTSIAVPFALGLLVALELHPDHARVAGGVVGLLPFSLFVATALSVTAFPVLARIVADSGMRGTRIGALALSAAALGDVLVWVMLAVAISVAKSRSPLAVCRILAANALLAIAMVVVVRPLLRRLVRRLSARSADPPGLITLAVAGAALSACATNALGTHFIFGAFLFGAVFPRERGFQKRLDAKLGPVILWALLPIYFAVPGLSVDLGALGSRGVAELALILIAACAGKFIGAAGAARACGMAWRESVSLGALMNARGLVELIVLNVGVSAGVLDERVYGEFVVMAIVTTLIAAPVLRLLQGRRASAKTHGLAVAPGRSLLPVDATGSHVMQTKAR